MSNDADITRSLIKTLEDGKQGFTKAAEKLAESDRADLSTRFSGFAGQRASFAEELRTMAATYDDDMPDSGTVAAVAHRGWMAVKDALAGSDPAGVLDAAEQGEDHAVAEYHDALAADISPALRAVVERQYVAVKKAHDTVRSLRNMAS